MSAYNPPIENTPIFNTENFIQVDSNGLTIQETDARYLKKTTPDVATAEETFQSGIITDSINSQSGTLSLGTTATSTINIGGASSNVTIYGSTTYLDVTNLQVEDKNILVNKTGIDCNGAGLSVENNGSVIASLNTDTTGDWVLTSTNNRLYTNEIQEKTIGNGVEIMSDLDLNQNDVIDVGSLQGVADSGLFIGHNSGTGTIDLWTSGTRRAQVLASGQLNLQTSIATSSATTGTLVSAGGIGCSGNIFSTGSIYCNGGNVGTTTATNLNIITSNNSRISIGGSSGDVFVQSGTASTSSTTGALRVTGGCGIGGAIYNAGLIGNLNTTQASNSGAGAIATDGGIASLKNMWAGGKVVGEGGLSSFSTQTAFKIQSTKLTPTSGNASWTFPSAYTTAPTITATAFLAGETNMRPVLITALSNTAVTVRCVKSDNSACESTVEIQVIAMGNA